MFHLFHARVGEGVSTTFRVSIMKGNRGFEASRFRDRESQGGGENKLTMCGCYGGCNVRDDGGKKVKKSQHMLQI
jgi:hypothetical protein